MGFLTTFSLATGALEAGFTQNDSWHLSAIDTHGKCRARLLLSLKAAPEFDIYDRRGKELF